MKIISGTKIIYLIIVLILSNNISNYAQLANHLVIAELYGGGGDQGSHWNNDYIVIYNPTSSAVNLSTWSVQYGVFSGSSWQITNLSGSISAGGYYSIQQGSGGRGVAPLPFTPNAVGNIDLDKNKGKVVLMNNQILLTVSNPNGNPGVVDFIGYGNGTDAFEGTAPAEQLGLTTSLRRKDNSGNNTYGVNGNGWDSNNNFTDTYVEANLVSNPPLPVELSSFSATIKIDKIILNWRTETEINNYGFEIHRQAQDDNWNLLGFVPGNGNSNSPKEYSFVDDDINLGKYSYRLKQIDTDGNFSYSKTIEVDLGSPGKFELSQNYPNPFNPTTTIQFTIPASGNVTLKVFNIIGEQVAELINGVKESGVHTINFNAEQLNSGFYIYKLESNNSVLTRKMILIK